MQSQQYTRQQLIEQATLSEEDLHEILQCRRDYSRLGFAYQIGFVRVKNRFPEQSHFEVIDDLLQFGGFCIKPRKGTFQKYVPGAIMSSAL